MQNEAVKVKHLVSATCFIRITSAPAHLDNINIELNLRWDFHPLHCDFQGDLSSVTDVL